jgi:hypothetical protein
MPRGTSGSLRTAARANGRGIVDGQSSQRIRWRYPYGNAGANSQRVRRTGNRDCGPAKRNGGRPGG